MNYRMRKKKRKKKHDFPPFKIDQPYPCCTSTTRKKWTGTKILRLRWWPKNTIFFFFYLQQSGIVNLPHYPPSKRTTTPDSSVSSLCLAPGCGVDTQQFPPASNASEIGLMTRMPSPAVAQPNAARNPTSETTP